MCWNIAPPCTSSELYDGMSYISSQILANRIDKLGELDTSDLSSFFDPKLSFLHPPELLKDMSLAAERVVQAIENKEKIRIHGDYDADGITATYVLYKTLLDLGADVSYMLPNREIDGYGVSDRFVKKCIEDPCLIITVDCGVTEYEKIKKLKEANIDIIITDHHKQGADGIPEGAFAVIDPKRDDEDCPFTSYAGVGVSFLLCWAVCKSMVGKVGSVGEYLKKLIPYVAIGTIADVMPLYGENRILTKVGLNMIRKGQVEDGVRHLMDISGLSLNAITAKDIGFMVAPRINSAGRMDDPTISLDCFVQGSRMMAVKLNTLNEERKEISQSLFEEAVYMVENIEKVNKAPILVIEGKEWHGGIVGIVAGKITERYGKPAIVISVDKDGNGRGSGRSVLDFNLHDAVSCVSGLLNRFGGHAQALGLSIKANKIDEFRDELTKTLTENGKLPKEYHDGPLLMIDCEVNLASITPVLMGEIEQLSPFGEGNPEPVFAIKNVVVVDYKAIGKGKNHLSLTVIQDGHSIRGVAFFAEHLIQLLNDGNTELDVAFTPVWNTFNGRTTLEMRIKDMRIPK